MARIYNVSASPPGGGGGGTPEAGSPVNAKAAAGSAAVIDFNEMIGVAGVKASGEIEVVDFAEAGGDPVAAEGTLTVQDVDQIGRKRSSHLTLNVNDCDGTPPQATITITDNGALDPAEGVQSNYFSALTAGSEWTIGVDADTTAESLKSAINTALGYAGASRVGAVITLVRDVPDGDNNWDVNFTVSGNGISTNTTVQGVGPLVFSLSGGSYTAGIDFVVGATIPDTLDNIIAAVGAVEGAQWDLTRDATTVYATDKTAGRGPATVAADFAVSDGAEFATAAGDVEGSGDTQAEGTIEIVDFAGIEGVGSPSTGTIEITNFALIVPGTVLTITDLAANPYTLTEGSEWTAGTDNDTTAESLRQAIENLIGIGNLVNASRVGAVITLSGALDLAEGDGIGMAVDNGTGFTLSGATLSGGVDGVKVTVSATTVVSAHGPSDPGTGLTAYGWSIGLGFRAVTNNDTTAESLLSALNFAGDLATFARVGAVITATAIEYGTGGNVIALAVDNELSGDVVISGAFLAGGENPGITLTVGDKTYDTSDFTVDQGGSESVTATSLAAAITADLPTGVASAVAVGAVVTITADPGEGGNSIGLATTEADAVSRSGATLTGGSGSIPAEITVGADVLIAGEDFIAETSNEVTAENLRAAIHALAGVNATRVGAVVTVEAATAGVAGNSIALATSREAFATVSGANLSGGVDEDANGSITIDGTQLQQGVDFVAETSEAVTAGNIRTAINGADLGVTAGGSGANITITANEKGAAGNAITLATGDAQGLTVSGANLTGGQDGTVGSENDVLFDDDYYYIAIADNTIADDNWRRAEIADVY